MEIIATGLDSMSNTAWRVVRSPIGGTLVPEMKQGVDATGTVRWTEIAEPLVAARVLATAVYTALRAD